VATAYRRQPDFPAACRPLYRDPFLTQIGTGLRSGELLGPPPPPLPRVAAHRGHRGPYEAGRFGRGFKAEPKSPASVRMVPKFEQVYQAMMRRLAGGARPEDLVFPGPGGSNGIPRRDPTPAS
jgi:hypothetical protein